MARQDLAYAITVNDAQLRLATQHVAAFNAELQASTVTGRKLDETYRAMGRRTVQVGNFFSRNLTLPLALVGVAAGKMSANFERSLAKIHGLTNTSAADTDRLGKAALDLGSSTITGGPSELADAMFKLRSVGFNVNQTIAAMPAIAKAAAAGLGSVATVADAVASALDAYGIAGQNAGKNTLTAAQATAVLIGTITAGKIAPEELARSIGRVIPVANALGISFDQVGAAIASITRQQGSANLAVTGLRALFSQLERAQPQTQKALASLGTGPGAVLEALKNPKIGLFPTLLALRQELNAKGKGPLNLDAKTLISGANGSVEALAKIRAEVGDTNQAMSKLFPNIRALTAFLIITGTRKNQNQTIFQALAFDVQHSQEIIKRAYEAKIKTPIGQLELQLSRLKTYGTEIGSSFIQAAAGIVNFANGVVSGVIGLDHFLKKLGPLKNVLKDIGIGALLFGPVTVLVGRLAQALSLGITAWGRAQAAATKYAYSLNGVDVEEDKRIIAERKAVVQLEQTEAAYGGVAAAADRAATSIARVGALGVRAGINAASAGNAFLSKSAKGSKLSRGGDLGESSGSSSVAFAALPNRMQPVVQTSDDRFAQLTARRASQLQRAQSVTVAANNNVVAAQTRVNEMAAIGATGQTKLAAAELQQARAALAVAQANERQAALLNQIIYDDQRLITLTKELEAAQQLQARLAAQGATISVRNQSTIIAGLQEEIALRQRVLAGQEVSARRGAAIAGIVPVGGGFARMDQRARELQGGGASTEVLSPVAPLTKSAETDMRVMGTKWGATIQGMRGAASLGFNFIALAFATNLVGKIVFDSAHTRQAVTGDLFSMQKAGIGAAAGIATVGAVLVGLSRAGGLATLTAGLKESGLAASLMNNKLKVAAAALVALNFAGVKTQTIFNAVMVGFAAKTIYATVQTLRLRKAVLAAAAAEETLAVASAAASTAQIAGAEAATVTTGGLVASEIAGGAAFGPWGIAAATAFAVIVGSGGRAAEALGGIRDELGNIFSGHPFRDNTKQQFFDIISKKLIQAATEGKKTGVSLADMRDELSKLGSAPQVDAVIAKIKDLRNAASGGVDDNLFKQLEHGLSRTGKIGELVKAAEALRNSGNEWAAEQTIAKAQIQQQVKDIARARAFLHAHGHDELANELFPIKERIKQARHEFDTLFSNIQQSVDNAFQARTSRILEGFDRGTQTILDNFDEKRQALADKLTFKVNVKSLGETFTIKVNGKTPAERELAALDKIAAKRTFRRDIFDARQQLGTALQIGDPNAIRDAERKMEDARTEQKRFGLEKRANTERTATDAAEKKAKQAFDNVTKRERQVIEDSRQAIRRNIEANRTILQQNLDTALKAQADAFNNGKIGLKKYQADVLGIMKEFGVSIQEAGTAGGKAYADQMAALFKTLADDVTKSTATVGAKAAALAAKLKMIVGNVQAQVALVASSFQAFPQTSNARVPGGATQGTGLPTRPAILKAMGLVFGGANYPHEWIPQRGSPSKSEYEAFLKKVADGTSPGTAAQVRQVLQGAGYFRAAGGGVVPGFRNGGVAGAPPLYVLSNANGLVKRGNIDLNHRAIVRNADGSISTEESTSFGLGGREVLMPTVFGGRHHSATQALAHYRRTGEFLGSFDSVADSNAYANRLHKRQARFYTGGGNVPGAGSTDTVPAMLTPGEIILNRDQQSNLSRMLGLSGPVSPHTLFSLVAQRFALGGVSGDSAPLPRLSIPGLNNLVGPLQRLVQLMTRAAIRSDQQAPGNDALMKELALGGHLDKSGKLVRDSAKKISQLRKQLDPQSANSLLMATIPHFGSMSGDRKRAAQAFVAQSIAHPVSTGLFTPHADGPDTPGGTRTVRGPMAINPAAFATGTSVGSVTIIVQGADKDPRQIATEVKREFERVGTHHVHRRRGPYAGRH